AEVLSVRRHWERRGLPIVALQSLLFGQPQHQVFGVAAVRRATWDYLAGMIDLAARCGAEALVFGSPKNRRRGALSIDEALRDATVFFRPLGERAARWGVCFCIEPTPPQYGCDFLLDTAQALRFVAQVDQPGLGLNLDTGGTALSGQSAELPPPELRRWW